MRVQRPPCSWDVRQSADGMMSEAVNLTAAGEDLRPMAGGEFRSGSARMETVTDLMQPLSLLACAVDTAFSAFPTIGSSLEKEWMGFESTPQIRRRLRQAKLFITVQAPSCRWRGFMQGIGGHFARSKA
jgi:hypothetical protein